jgi:O-antigen ligase
MEIRRVVVTSLTVCLVAAMAPWFSGGQEPIAMLIGAMALLLAALLLWRQPEARKLKVGLLVVAFCGLMLLGLLSLIWSASRYSTGLWIVQWALMGLAFVLAYTLSGEPKGRELVAGGYLLSSALFCGIAHWMYLTSAYPRLTGTFYWPNPAAAYLIPAILIALDRVVRALGRQKLWWGGATGLFIATFLLTDSRAATLVLIMVVAAYVLLVPLNRTKWTRIVFIGASAFLASMLLAQLSTITVHRNSIAIPGSRFAEAAGGESRSLSDRVNYILSAAHMWASHPLLGEGAGTYGDVHPQFQQRVVSASTSAHNVYIQTSAELGSLGIVLLVLVLAAVVAGAARGLAKDRGLLPIALGLLGLLVHFGLDIDARYPALLTLAAVLAGLLYVERAPSRSRVTWRRPAATAALLVPVVGLYQSSTWAASAKVAQDDSDYGEASSRFDLSNRGVLHDPDNINAAGIAYYTLSFEGGPDEKANLSLALQRSEQAQRLDPHDAQHHQLKGRVLVKSGDLHGAIKEFREALRLDPYNHPEYALDLATAKLRAHDYDGARKSANAMLALYPVEVVANRNADTTIRPALSNLQALIGNSYLQQGALEQARAAAHRALRWNPQGSQANWLMDQVQRAAQMSGQ